MAKERFQLKYLRSKFWLVFWLLLFFPIAIVLLFCHLQIVSGKRTFLMEYNGSRFWLFFWAILFFPLVILLLLLNGSFVKKTKEAHVSD